MIKYALAKKSKDGFGNDTEVYFTGWWSHLPEEPLIQPKWGHPHADGCRDVVLYADMQMIRHVLKQLRKEGEEHMRGVYVVEMTIHSVLLRD